MYKYLFGPVPSRRLGMSLGVDLVPKKVRDELIDANVVFPSLDAAPERKNIQSYRKDAETAILCTITRRPCTVDDLVKILGLHINEINKYLDVLEAEGKIGPIRQERGVFYQIKYK